MQKEQDKKGKPSEEVSGLNSQDTDPTVHQQPLYKERQRNENRLMALVGLNQMNDRGYTEVLDFGLEEALRLTDSKIGYIFFYDEEARQFSLYSWSKGVMETCHVLEKRPLYELDKTGLWGEVVRQRRPIITNDYNAPNPYKKGYPEGHVEIKRHMTLPIFRKGKIVSVVGVANKEEDYTEADVRQLQLFMDGLWNIVERKQYEERLKKSEELLKTVSDFTYDWEYWVSPSGDILYCSPSCLKITGYNPEEFINKSVSLEAIVHPDDRESFLGHRSYYQDSHKEETEIQYRIITKNGDIRWIEHACRSVFSPTGEYLGRRVSSRDISERKAKEKELSDSRTQIGILNKNILNMLKVMSHDIRGPLISISATLKLLLRGAFGRLDENVYQTVKDLSMRVNQVLGLAEECLAKAQSVDNEICIEKAEIDLRHEVIEPVLAELAGEIEQNGIYIDNRLGAIPTGAIKVNASKVWLKVVYRNLFSNAIKYGGRGCTIAFGYEDHGSYYRFNVYNTGAQIPEDKRGVLFTKFGRILDITRGQIRPRGAWYGPLHDKGDNYPTRGTDLV